VIATAWQEIGWFSPLKSDRERTYPRGVDIIAVIASAAALASAAAAWHSARLASRRTEPLLTLQPGWTADDLGCWHLENVGGAVGLQVVWALVGRTTRYAGRTEPAGVLRPGERVLIVPEDDPPDEFFDGLIACLDGRDVLYAWNLAGDFRRFRQRRTRWQVWRQEDYNLEVLYATLNPCKGRLENRLPGRFAYEAGDSDPAAETDTQPIAVGGGGRS
jgi:hypothetical protein